MNAAGPVGAGGVAGPPAPVSFGEAFRFWLRLGFISFGGPAGQIAVMHTELVERRRWISEKRFLHALNYCMLLPGPEAIQLAIYIGWLLHRVRGGVVAGVLFLLPSVFILVALSWIYMAYGELSAVAGIFYGIKPAVVAIVIAAAVAGALGGRYAPQVFAGGGGHGGVRTSYGPALIDDDTPTPEHARYSLARLSRVLGIGLALWAAGSGALIAAFSWEHTATQMGWFFTKAALLTFGGAYAVLPYVYQAAVEQYQWLTAVQMIDGLALGETTPGPLIMVVAFVGFVGGWAKELFGPEHRFLSGTLCALVATFFTFLPSFIFILIGGPLVETTHGELKFTAPLTGITAAVVGVIVSLAVFFSRHVFFPSAAAPDWISAAGAAIALVALMRFRVDLIALILAMGGAGMVLRLSGLA